jgi:hypothetical protein
MYNLVVEIVRVTDNRFPGWVACEFVDADGRRHTVVDKVPIFGLDSLDARSKYSQPGIARCEVLDRWRDERARELARISLARPDDLESTDGLSEFVVTCAQLSVERGEES